MFDPSPIPRLFSLPPGADFPKQLLAGLASRLDRQPPQTWARILLIVNTRRMARRLRDLCEAGPPRMVPQIKLITDLDTGLTELPPAIPPLRRRLELAQLVARLVEAQPDLAPKAAVYDLADSLADLFAEMQGEGVGPDKIAKLDVTDLSGHWARAQRFIAIAGSLADPEAPEAEARQRLVAESLAQRWADQPPQTPVILAGSTGSRGMMQILMNAVARLPQGAVVLPGYDADLPDEVWHGMRDQLTTEDHPQYRYKVLMDQMNIGPSDILPWTDTAAPAPARNKVLSLALRPAPVTHAWLSEGPGLPDLTDTMQDVTLVEAEDPRSEALAIALRLRQSVEDGQATALITPDRMLTRQVEAALDRWGIIADDSAGQPLHLAPPGRFLRQMAELEAEPATPEMLLALLKHPLCHSGAGRPDHLIHTRDLELWLRRNGPPHPDAATLDACAADMEQQDRTPPPAHWRAWVAQTFLTEPETGPLPLTHRITALRARAEHAAKGSVDAEGAGGLWDQNAGQEALAVLDALDQHADAAGDMSARDAADLLAALLQRETVRDRDKPHPLVMIWGTLEARVQGADLLILGGLNEGSWPEAAKPDPWLNRQLRKDAGLLLPERRIGLAAHDFQQAAGAPEVWMTRSKRSADAETVPSRWVNRLTNLLGGLPGRNGPQALSEMRARGQIWLDRARALERAPSLPPATRPSPRPPVEARPQRLSVTQIKTLIRDPYAIYARHVLKLRALDPLRTEPDALLRGTVLHEVLEVFVKETPNREDVTEAKLMEVTDRILDAQVPWAAERRLWRARMSRIARWFVAGERVRRDLGTPQVLEVKGSAVLEDPPFRLTGTADRIDRDGRGGWVIYDYKTGKPPSKKEQKLFDKQLLLEAAMVTQGAFQGLDAGPVARAVFLGLAGDGHEVSAPLDETPVDQVWSEFRDLLTAYRDPGQGFTARRMLQKDTDVSDYDQLARFGEWDMADDPTPEDLT